MEMIATCFNKNVNSVIMQVPDPEESFQFKMCVRKFSRVKMRAISYYHGTLHKNEDLMYKNLRMLRPFMNQ